MKTFIWAGMIMGSIIGGYIPILFGSSTFSIASVLGNGIGGIIGIWLGYKLADSQGL